MKKILFFSATALFAFALLTPGLGLGSFTAAAAPVAVADDPQAPPPAPPQGVSPADPKMQMPDFERGCCCGCCCRGAMGGAHMERGKARFGRPALAPDDKGTMQHCEKADRPYRSMMHQRAARERQMDRKAMRCEMMPGKGMGPCGGMMRGEGKRQCCDMGRGKGMGPRCEMAPGKGMGPGPMDGRDHLGWGTGGGGAAERMLRHAEELDLSADQKAKLEALAFQTQKKLVDLRAAIEKGQLELRNQLQSGSDDMGQIKSHLEAIARARTGIQEARIANLLDTRKVLTEKQKKLIEEKFPRLEKILE